MIALDTETTGLDLYHDARPYLVTVCDDDGEVRWWEWAVDPLTREVRIPPADRKELNNMLAIITGWGTFAEDVRKRHRVVGHNIKFDATALERVGIGPWPWDMTEDTLVAAHLLASNADHDLTALATDYLGEDIKPYEDRLKEAVGACRRRVQQARLARKRGPAKTETAKRRAEKAHDDPLADWLIAEEGVPGMPSAGKDPWKADGWLPRAIAEFDNLDEFHPYWTVLSEYANADSETTIRLWFEFEAEMERRGLEMAGVRR